MTLSVSILYVASGKAYKVIPQGFINGALVYIDRSYTFNNLTSGSSGATYIQTANNDKTRTEPNFLSFDVNQEVIVGIAYDTRATFLPAWLSGWTNTGKLIGTTDVDRKLYTRNFPAGTITLGGNMASPAAGAQSNYNVIIVKKGATFPTNLIPNETQGLQEIYAYPNPAVSPDFPTLHAKASPQPAMAASSSRGLSFSRSSSLLVPH